jgi:hypothetical protein
MDSRREGGKKVKDRKMGKEGERKRY